MSLAKHKKLLLVIPLLIAVYYAGKVELPLGGDVAEFGEAQGAIVRCDINQKHWTKADGITEVGITLDDPDAPFLRWDLQGFDIDTVDRWCHTGSEVSFSYRAQRTLLRPSVSYWVESAQAVP